MLQEILENLAVTPQIMFRIGEKWRHSIPRMGINVFTEVCNTLRPKRFPVLNWNPITSLATLEIAKFPSPQTFTASHYENFTRALQDLRQTCQFSDLGETDHFLNFIYWNEPAHRSSKTSKRP
jgi:hypothetical protein